MKALINIFTAVLTGLNAGAYRNPANYTATENESYINSIGADELDQRARELKPIEADGAKFTGARVVRSERGGGDTVLFFECGAFKFSTPAALFVSGFKQMLQSLDLRPSLMPKEADGASGGDTFAEAVQFLAKVMRPERSKLYGCYYMAHIFNGHAVATSAYFFAVVPVEGAPSESDMLLCDLGTAKRPEYKRADDVDRDGGRAWKYPDQIRRVLDGSSKTAYAINRAAALAIIKTGATYIQLAPGVVVLSSTLKRLMEAGATKRDINAVLYFDGRLKIWTDTPAGIFGGTIITEPDELRESPAVLEAQQVSLCSLIRL